MTRPRPLSDAERAALDAKAKALGIMPKDELDELMDDDDEDEEEAATQAPAPVVTAATGIPRPGSARRRLEKGHEATVVHSDNPRIQVPIMSRPQLPDFRKVETFDLVSSVIYVDGMAFPIPTADLGMMKTYAVQVALDHVVRQLALALIEFGVPAAAADAAAKSLRDQVADGRSNDSDVSGVSASATADGVPAESDTEAGLDVPAVSSEGSEAVSGDAGGVGAAPAE